jgi:hypothetical protein
MAEEMEESRRDIMSALEEIPTQTYLGLAFGSVVLSAFLYLIGRRSASVFVGQWAPTFGVLALVYKLLRPSREQPMGVNSMGDLGEVAENAVRQFRRRRRQSAVG